MSKLVGMPCPAMYGVGRYSCSESPASFLGNGRDKGNVARGCPRCKGGPIYHMIEHVKIPETDQIKHCLAMLSLIVLFGRSSYLRLSRRGLLFTL